MILYRPISRAYYLAVPAVSALAAGAGAALILWAADAPCRGVIGFAGGIGLVAGWTGALVAFSVVGRERERYLQYRLAALSKIEPEPAQPEPDEWRELRLPTGKQGWTKNATPQRFESRYQATRDTFTRIEVTGDNGTTDQTVLVDVSWGLWTIAHRYQQVNSWTESAWDKARVFPSVNHYRTVRGYMISRHLLRWRNPAAHRAGVELTRSGQAVIDHLRGENQPRPPIHVPVQAGFALA